MYIYIYIYICIYIYIYILTRELEFTYRRWQEFQDILEKNVQLLWTVVTYLLKNVKHEIEHDIYSTYGDIRHS